MKKLLLGLLACLSLTACSHITAAQSFTNSNDNSLSGIIILPDPPEWPDAPEGPQAPETPDDQKIYEVNDLVSYFNTKGEEEGIQVAYDETEDYWYLHYIVREDADDSKNNLASALPYFLDFLPLYGLVENGYVFRYLSKYMTEDDIYFIYVATSSNHFAACSMYSYIETNNLVVDVIIYDGRTGLYV